MLLPRIIVLTFALILPSFLWAMSCSEYNSMGPNVKSEQELSEHRITKAQIDVVRKNTAHKAARVSALLYTPMAIKLKRIMNDKTLLAKLSSGTSTLVRIQCFRNPNNDFYETVSDQFEIVVEYISKKHE